jgi:hypothetical protein
MRLRSTDMMKAWRTRKSEKMPRLALSCVPNGRPLESPIIVLNLLPSAKRRMSSGGVRSETSISPDSSAATRVPASGMKRETSFFTALGPWRFMKDGAQL